MPKDVEKKDSKKLIKVLKEIHKPHWTVYASIFILAISLLINAINTRTLIAENQPFVVWNQFACPNNIYQSTGLDVSFTNIGGSHSAYSAQIQVHGFKCIEDIERKYNSVSYDTIKELNKKINQTECNISYAIAKDAMASNKLLIFQDDQYTGKNATINISYSYVVGNKWTDLAQIKNCQYHKDMTQGYTNWILNEQN